MLVCRPNLDLYWGVAGRYRRRYGNLRRDDARQVLRAALAGEARPAPAADGEQDDALWFTLDPIPSVRELAERYGDPKGDGVHLHGESPRRRWLDLAQQHPQARY